MAINRSLRMTLVRVDQQAYEIPRIFIKSFEKVRFVLNIFYLNSPRNLLLSWSFS